MFGFGKKPIEITKAVEPGEITPSQVDYIISSDALSNPNLTSSVSYATYRAIRKDPTIALARALITATVLSGKWSVEAEENIDDEIVEFIKTTVVPLRDSMMLNAIMFGAIDFGWQAFEKVFEKVKDRVVLKKLKPLLHDISEILVEDKTGAFAGIRQNDTTLVQLDMLTDKIFHVAFQVEGSNWYGQPLLENSRASYDSWTEANTGAKTYDKKVAGSHFVVYYPPGSSIIDGVSTPNSTVAKQLLTALENSGSIVVPRIVTAFIDKINDSAEQGWNIDILQDSGGKQPQFIERLRYLDSLKVRGLGVPERGILEGQFGTKAESGEHGDMAVVNIQEMDRQVTTAMNVQVVDQLLALNFGPDLMGKVWLSAMPLIDEQAMLFKQIYQQIIGNPEGFAQEFMTLDTDAMKDKLGLPKTDIVAGGQDALAEFNVDKTQEVDALAASIGLKLSGSDATDGHWITVNGSKLFIPNGENVGDVIRKIFDTDKEIKSALDEVKSIQKEEKGKKLTRFEKDVIVGDYLPTSKRLEFPIKGGVNASSSKHASGFGNCTANALEEYKGSHADVWVGYAVRKDRYNEALALYRKDGTWGTTEAIPHAWNVKNDMLIDKTFGSTRAKEYIYFGVKIPKEDLEKMKSDTEIASWRPNNA